ncbi:uncharacterized protein THITE_75012 [Thermothielavioides terrestris NRRL 8126]|uniref:BZIP domain-containing protein n=1 Tax=Thermothielavioides terrestris (strain ATCC 38088 / NRRL 8126) TaxID=578455 RepID=G2RGQ6_THETT|nr:uncharacterized protein THITE_75012 [Thermothielavioides terrestris NRRL 8126]AEO71088.1 hypothetical protein THITE_75012 [Thermothielavioides terrestris NRRL 8126]
MSYSGAGRGVNVSQYLRNLNVQEPAAEETLITDEDLAKDLALFTNTQFYDFETGQHTDYQAPPVKPEATTNQSSPAEDVSSTDPMMGDFPAGFDFMSGDFSFGDFSSTYTSPTIPAFPDAHALGNLQPIQPNPQAAYAVAGHGHNHQHQHQPAGYVPPTAPRIGAGAGEKRRAESISPPNGRVLSFEEASRLAAEEDKRRRNTAASARFRIKKKQREQALEKSAKEMSEKVTILEGRISALETENKWLKSLVTEKHGGRDDILEKLLKELAASSQESKKDAGSTDGGEIKDSIHAATSDEKSSKKKD